MAQYARGHRCFAALYDPLIRPLERQVMEPLRRRLALLQGTILEIGAGTGANLPYYSPAATVVATEPDPFMLGRARQKLIAGPRPSPALCQADAQALPFAGQTFDHVVCTLVLCSIAAPELALGETRRVLKPGGRLHFIEHVRGDGLLGRGQDLIAPAYSYFAGGCQPNLRTADLLESTGFVTDELRVRRIQLGIPLLIGTASVR